MPSVIQGAPSQELDQVLRNYSYDYKYPKGLDLRPGSDLHKKIKTEVLTRAIESYDVMKCRHSSWNKIDRTLTAYVPLDTEEKKIKKGDARKPVSVVIPVTYAALDTLLAYWMSTFLEEPYFRYTGHGPEDTIGAILMEKIIQLHCDRLKVGLQLYIMWRDSLAYGFGAVAPIWFKKMGKKATFSDDGFFSSLYNRFMPGNTTRGSTDTTLFEGNKLINIDPYKALPDPNVPIHEVQECEFWGWIDNTNIMSLLRLEEQESGYINVKYLHKLRQTGCRSSLFGTDESLRTERYNIPTPSDSKTHPVDVVYMYIDLIPKAWKLGKSEYPEKWFFGVAADEIVIRAQPLGLNHNMTPIVVCAPGFDGYSVTPIAALEVSYGAQEAIDWLFSSHFHNIRKSLHDMFLVDPYLVNIYDFQKPGPGRLLRMRREAWGNAKLDQAIKQLDVKDVTSSNIGDAGALLDLMNRTLGTSDTLSGVARQSSERKSATEVRGARSGGLTRLEKSAKIASLMGMYDIAYFFAMHTQQLMSDIEYVKSAGEWESVLRKEFGVDNDRIKVRPQDIIVDYDIVSRDGSVPSGEYADTWINLWAIMSSNEQISGEFDMVRIFKHIARLMGAKNLEEFIKKGGDVNVRTMPDEAIEKSVQAGNMIPLKEDMGGI